MHTTQQHSTSTHHASKLRKLYIGKTSARCINQPLRCMCVSVLFGALSYKIPSFRGDTYSVLQSMMCWGEIWNFENCGAKKEKRVLLVAGEKIVRVHIYIYICMHDILYMTYCCCTYIRYYETWSNLLRLISSKLEVIVARDFLGWGRRTCCMIRCTAAINSIEQ